MNPTIVKRFFKKSEQLPELINVLYSGDLGREEVEAFIEEGLLCALPGIIRARII